MHIAALALAVIAGSTPQLASVRPVTATSVVATAAAACPASTDATLAATSELGVMRCVVTSVRTSYGLQPLRSSSALNRSAAMKADMIRRCGFSHSACGRPFTWTFQRVGYFRGTVTIGENIAWGQDDLGSPLHTVTDWLESPAHRQNLLGRSWRDSGVAFQRGSMFGTDGVLLWVLQVGRRS